MCIFKLLFRLFVSHVMYVCKCAYGAAGLYNTVIILIIIISKAETAPTPQQSTVIPSVVRY